LEISAQLPDDFSNAIAEAEETNTRGMDRRLASILDRYYESSFGGVENWQQIRTIRFEGKYRSGESTTRFVGLRKKPNLLRLTIFRDDGSRRIMAFDGEDAWAMTTGAGREEPTLVDEDSARDFIRGAKVGGHLFYPQQEGKEIRILGHSVVDGHGCHEIELTLPNGEKSIHMIDTETFVERRTIITDYESGLQKIRTHSDFRVTDGVPFSFYSELEVDGKVLNRIVLTSVKTNIGIPSWTFEMPDQ
jgi:hypothetical protein